MADLTSSITAAMAAPATPEAKTPTEAAKAPPAPAAKEAKAPATPEAVKEVKEAIRKHKLKVDNEEIEVDDDELKRGYAHNKAASKRMEEAAAYRKQAEQAFEMLKDPSKLRQLLEDPRVGIDLKKFAEDYVWENLQNDALTPEQKKQREVERELEKYRQSEKAAKEQAETREATELQNKYAAEYETTIIEALDKGGVPKNRASVRRMAQYLQLAVANNIDVTPADLVARVRQDLIDEHKSMYGESDPASLLSILGEDLAKKIREADVKRLKSTQPEARRRPAGNAKPVKAPEKRRERMSADTIAEKLREKFKG